MTDQGSIGLDMPAILARMRWLLDQYEPGRERSLAATKLDEFELWLTRCMIKDES